ncbi:glycosyltransferase family 4 protein [Mariprofundus sp. NF]|uniref:glycosyltransferase family 4 protein n=1 Tax=Mariprofundus sp. NF TaxID=2608716 RepID=UPI0015A45883|nr:glycosyltransferase family 4 protein [Mariprofundus sp. NF]NWF39427.1 glycosyltransferase family 4 protein [Mariprofundus sp. NF]
MIPLKLVHIARHYGPVGGMERYVWELTRELALMGHQVTVLCEKLAADSPPQGVEVIELGLVHWRPRWLAHLRFSRKVSAWVAANPDSERIIHSHERTAVHHVTTFHGPPFAKVKSKPLWQRFSPRIAVNLWLERRELCGDQVRAVVPNSSLIANALLNYYPEINERLVEPVSPGVDIIPARPQRLVDEEGGVIGFVGKEWRRKGLDIAVEIVSELKKRRPALQFVVAGPDPEKVAHLFSDWSDGYQLLGPTDVAPLYASFDLLLHPARQEPYGMVIAEARAAGLPVLVSSACGICSELEPENIMNIGSGTLEWSHACEKLIGQPAEVVIHSWKAVAEEQLACYQRII